MFRSDLRIFLLAMSLTNVNLTSWICRMSDQLMLAATMDASSQINELSSKTNRIIASLNDQSPSRCSVSAGQFTFHWLIEREVCFLALCEREYPKGLAFQYLEELQASFHLKHGREFQRYSRAYQAVEFEPEINRMRRKYLGGF